MVTPPSQRWSWGCGRQHKKLERAENPCCEHGRSRPIPCARPPTTAYIAKLHRWCPENNRGGDHSEYVGRPWTRRAPIALMSLFTAPAHHCISQPSALISMREEFAARLLAPGADRSGSAALRAHHRLSSLE